MANRPPSVGGRGEAAPLHIGQPISDSSSTDGEDDQIHQLNEEHGIDQHYPEVEVPPKDEEEDEPIGGLDDEPDPPDLPDGNDEVNRGGEELEDYDEEVDQRQSTAHVPPAHSAFETQFEDDQLEDNPLEDNPLEGNEDAYDDQQVQEDETIIKPYGETFDPPKGPPPPYDIGGDSPEQNPLAEEEDSSYSEKPVVRKRSPTAAQRALWDSGLVNRPLPGEEEAEEEKYRRKKKKKFISEEEREARKKRAAAEYRERVAMDTMRRVGLTASDSPENVQVHADPSKADGSDEDDSEAIEGAYDADEYSTLPVGSDIKELFQFITAYQPQTVEIEPMLKPFVLDYIPAVGDIDAFIKIPRPDDVEDNLGLLVLDEPSAKQSDPTILDLHMRVITKEGAPKDTVVKRLDRADRNSKEIEQWITNITELHRSKPATNVHYSRPMPDIELLMQEWPPEVESMLKRVELPSADMDVSLEQYVDIVLNFLDIPVHKSRIQSLHVLFTLYSEFKNSQHFRSLAEKNDIDNERGEEDSQPDRLIL